MSVRLEHLHPETDHVPVVVFNALVDIVNTLCDGADLYEAHVENLIGRVRDLEVFTKFDESLPGDPEQRIEEWNSFEERPDAR